MDNKMTMIDIEHYGNKMTMYTDQDADIQETLETMITIMVWFGFDYHMIISEMKSKVDETYRRFNSKESNS